MFYQGVITHYKKYLPVNNKTPIITLQEGNTPLLEAKNLVKKLGINFKIFLKCEGFNPTGSFKDRGMTVAISKAVESGAKAVICASTGNTSASAAAYSARAGLKCIVLIPSGAIALGKLSQAIMHGAKVIPVDGNFDVALKLTREISENYPVTLVNSLNPYRIEGQKTAAFEIVDYLSDLFGKPIFPDYQFMPVGNAGNITAYWKGYVEYQKSKIKNQKSKTKGNRQSSIVNRKLPKMMGFQASGSAPIVLGHPIEKPETIATAIRIGNPASWKQAVAARDESGGMIDTVTDEEILTAYKLLASLEGVFVEPASAASVAGLIKYVQKDFFSSGTQELIITCILTGHGLKDPERAIKVSAQDLKPVKPELKTLVKEIGL